MASDDISTRARRVKLTPKEYRFIVFVDDRTRHFDGVATGRQYAKSTAESLVAKGVLETFGAYKVDDYDNLTDRWGIAYRFTDLGREVHRLATERPEEPAGPLAEREQADG